MPASTARNTPAYNEPHEGQGGTLVKTENWWRDRYDDIENQGYRLTPRYHPRWEPSSWPKAFYSAENGHTILRAATDATRIQDGYPVMLKKVLPEEGPHELNINMLFTSPELSRNRDNHCAPLLEVIELSGRFGSQKLMVFPALRPLNRIRIRTFGEFAAFFTQICEGIRFMHEQNVAHRDCTANNIMFNPSKMYPDVLHPANIDRTRTFMSAVRAYMRQPRPRYYFTCLELSVQYPSRDTMDEPWFRQDESAPEHQSGRRCNPFHTDVYYIGNLVQEEFLKKYNGFEFMDGLVASMTQDNPAKRPLIEDVLQRFSHIQESLSQRKLRSALASKSAPKYLVIIQRAWEPVCTLRDIVIGRPAIPDYYS